MFAHIFHFCETKKKSRGPRKPSSLVTTAPTIAKSRVELANHVGVVCFPLSAFKVSRSPYVSPPYAINPAHAHHSAIDVSKCTLQAMLESARVLEPINDTPIRRRRRIASSRPHDGDEGLLRRGGTKPNPDALENITQNSARCLSHSLSRTTVYQGFRSD